MEVDKAARKIMVALHDNEESLYALEWALNHLINPVIGCNSSKFVLIYAAPEAMASTPLTGKEIAFSSHVVGVLKRNQKRMAEKVMEQATKLCQKHGILFGKAEGFKDRDHSAKMHPLSCCLFINVVMAAMVIW
ncbi:uncharacterized protein LOC116263912 isoform X2 [Nymphaea colorata]|nr:uncharacterized protein LOC116263912 isoform X2 [Nymphaea colorata]